MPAPPVRVLHLCAGNLYGGVERIVAECAAGRALSPSMTPSFAVCFDGRLAEEIEATGARCARLGAVRVSRPLTIRRARRRLAEVLEAERPGAVICHSSWVTGLAAPAVRAHGAPVVLWVHDALSGRTWVERWARRSHPDFVIANSRFSDDSVRAVYPDTPHAVVYAPVSPAQSGGDDRHAVRAALGADDTTPVVIVASRFEAWKGHRELITALAAVREPWHLWIAGRAQREGEETYERGLRESAKVAGVSARVQFLGERRDVPALMRAADVHCQPNTGPEPFGLAFVEALYAGLPVVTTAIGGACEIVTDDCGILVPRGDARALEEALRRLVTDGAARRRLGSSGPARASALCDPARQLDALASIAAGMPARPVTK